MGTPLNTLQECVVEALEDTGLSKEVALAIVDVYWNDRAIDINEILETVVSSVTNTIACQLLERREALMKSNPLDNSTRSGVA
jgi:hypothetical protein